MNRPSRKEAWEIVGAGGIGCAVGYALARAGCQVTFVESDPAKLAWGREFGVQVAGLPALPADFQAFGDWSPDPAARLLLCTKAYDNEKVLERIPANHRV